MSYNYPHNNTYQPTSSSSYGVGAQPHSGSRDNRRPSPHSHAPPSTQVGNISRTSRSLSSTRTPFPGQAQTTDPYGTGQNREYLPADSRSLPSSHGHGHGQPYISSQQSAPIPEAYHQPIEQAYVPPGPPPPQQVSPYGQPHHRSASQQRSVPHNVGAHPGNTPAQYPYGGQEYSSRNLQQQPPSTHYQHQQSSTTHHQKQPIPSTPYQQEQPTSTPIHYQQEQFLSTPTHYQAQQPSSTQTQYQQQKSSGSGYQYSQQQQSSPPLPFVANVSSASASERPSVDRRASSSSRGSTQTSTCRFPHCHLPVTVDVNTQELSEYCGMIHMQDDLRRGVPACPACGKCPRRVNSDYCGASCQAWAAQQRQQHSPTSPENPQSPSSGSYNWSNITAGSSSASVDQQVQCRKCGTTYLARGRGGSRSGTQPGNPAGYGSLPPCPACGHATR